MHTGQKLAINIVQKLQMSQQMQQSLNILQISTYELINLLDQEIKANPFLEKHETSNNIEYFGDDLHYQTVRCHNNDNNNDSLSYIQNDNLSLKEHLISQINIELYEPQDKEISLYLVDLLNDNGYLEYKKDDLVFNVQHLNRVLKKLYKLDPVGCFAFNLQDCLRIQLQEKQIFNQQYNLLLHNLNTIALGDIKKLQKICGVSKDMIIQMIEQVKQLNPKPGRNFSNLILQTKIPDAIIEFAGDGNINIRLNEAYMPKVIINSESYNMMLNKTQNKDEKVFCKQNYKKANFIQRALIQRASTICNIVNIIAKTQYEFFEKGVQYLKPMKLADIAKTLGINESTVSRCSNKVVQTPVGVFEIKYFFTSKIASSISENTYSSKAVKQIIKNIIENETKVLSDDVVAKLLNKKGMNISRRTVSKYREAISIPASHYRKRLQKISG